MADMMKKMGKGGMMKTGASSQMMGKGGMPDPSKMTPEQLAEAAKGMQQGMGGMGGARHGRPAARDDAACGPVGADEEEMIQRPQHIAYPSAPVLATARLVPAHAAV